MSQRIDTLKSELSRAQTTEARITLLHEITWYCGYSELADQMTTFLADAHDLFSTTDTIPARYHTHHRILEAYQQGISGKHVEALQTILDISNDPSVLLTGAWLWRVPYLLAMMHSYTGNSGDALDSFHEALTLADEQHDLSGQFHALNGIGFVYTYMEDQDQALTYFQKSLDAAVADDDIVFQWTALVNLGHVYLKQSNLDAAEKVTQDALPIARQGADERQLGFSYARIVQIQIDREACDQAADLIRATLPQISHTPANWHPRTLLLRQLARIHYTQGQYDEAIRILRQILQQARDLNNQVNVLENLEELSKAYEKAGDFQQALATYREYFELYRKFQDEQNSTRIRMLETLHRTREAEAELHHQKQQTQEAVWRAEQTRQYFEELNAMQSQLIDFATHDLKNPLSGIRLQTQVMRQKIDPSYHHHLDFIEDGTRRMQQLIADMLDVARLETGNALKRSLNSLNQVLDTALNDMQAAAQQKQITIHTQLPDTPVSFYFDANYIHRCLCNLLDNAIKYTDPHARIDVSVQDTGETVTIIIADTGIGISPAALPHIFDRFYRVQDDSTTYREGTGLGLSLVKNIIEQHGGTISVKSEPGHGTTFHIHLPCLESPADQSDIF